MKEKGRRKLWEVTEHSSEASIALDWVDLSNDWVGE